MEYKLVYQPYAFSTLVNTQSKTSSALSEREATEVSKILNENGKNKWRVVNFGTLISGNDIVFWALLERQETAKGVILD